jgi:hypothetical protein
MCKTAGEPHSIVKKGTQRHLPIEQSIGETASEGATRFYPDGSYAHSTVDKMMIPSLIDVTHEFLQQMLIATGPLELWSAIQKACADISKAITSVLYLYDPNKRKLQQVIRADENLTDPLQTRSTYYLGQPISINKRNSIAKAARKNECVQYLESDSVANIAVPLGGHPDWNTETVAGRPGCSQQAFIV